MKYEVGSMSRAQGGGRTHVSHAQLAAGPCPAPQFGSVFERNDDYMEVAGPPAPAGGTAAAAAAADKAQQRVEVQGNSADLAPAREESAGEDHAEGGGGTNDPHEPGEEDEEEPEVEQVRLVPGHGYARAYNV